MENKEKQTDETLQQTADIPDSSESAQQPDGRDLQEQLEQSRLQLEAAQKEKDEAKELLQRTLAEYDNFRKRSAKEKAESFSNGCISAVNRILPVIDTLEMALGAPCSDENYKKGIEMTLAAAQNALKNLGVEVIEAMGKPFDPTVHNAVMQESVEGTEAGIVTKELQKGYRLADKVIRHSTVAVSC